MKITTDINNVINDFRQILITQSNLDEDRVLNALSLNGTELDVLLEDSVYTSITQDNTTLLFTLNALPSESNVSMEEGTIFNGTDLTCSPASICSQDTLVGDVDIDTSITSYNMYQFKLMIYGNNSYEVATSLVARLRSTAVRTQLYSCGIYLSEIFTPETINEFKNNCMWLRNDVLINIGIKYSVSQISDTTPYAKTNTITIIRRS